MGASGSAGPSLRDKVGPRPRVSDTARPRCAGRRQQTHVPCVLGGVRLCGAGRAPAAKRTVHRHFPVRVRSPTVLVDPCLGCIELGSSSSCTRQGLQPLSWWVRVAVRAVRRHGGCLQLAGGSGRPHTPTHVTLASTLMCLMTVWISSLARPGAAGMASHAGRAHGRGTSAAAPAAVVEQVGLGLVNANWIQQ